VEQASLPVVPAELMQVTVVVLVVQAALDKTVLVLRVVKVAAAAEWVGILVLDVLVVTAPQHQQHDTPVVYKQQAAVVVEEVPARV
jgi:hypothetical protein